MCAIFVDVNMLYALTIDIPSELWTFVYHEASLPGLSGAIGESGAKKSRAYNQIVISVFHEILQFLYYLCLCFFV